jgi:VanZ family protein
LRNAEQLGRWAPALLWAAVIWTLSTGWFGADRTAEVVLPVLAVLLPGAPPAELRAIHEGLRKAAHFGEYMILSVLLYRALRAGHRFDLRAAGLAFALAGAYAVSDELHQWFVPGRTAAATDCLIDMSGAAAAQGLLAARARARAPWR